MDNNPPEFKKSYYSVTPADVRYCRGIPDGAKLLYGEISALCNERGYCWAGNEYFAELYGLETRTVSRWFSALVKQEFIYIDMNSGRRKIFLAKKFMLQEIATAQAPAPDVKEAGPKAKPLQKTKKAKPAQVKKLYTDEDLFLAELLLSKIIFNFPTFENKKVNIGEWAEDIRKLREIDKATVEQIKFMITWLQGGEIVKPGKPTRKFEPHDFWAKNIMSARKLRKQWFENLVPQLQEYVKKTIKKNTVTQL